MNRYHLYNQRLYLGAQYNMLHLCWANIYLPKKSLTLHTHVHLRLSINSIKDL